MNEKYDLIDGIIPSILCCPISDTPEPTELFPAILLLHGFGSQKNEVGDFYINLAHKLAAQDIASLRIDFQGFGESRIDMCLSSLDNMLSDALSAYAHLAQHPLIDSKKIAICGFSLGAYIAFRLAHILEHRNSTLCPALIMLSPSGHPADSFTRVLGCSDLDPLTKPSVTTFDMGWRTVSLGPCFFESLLSNPPIVALGQLNTPSLSIAAREDLTYPYLEKIAQLTKQPDSKTITIEQSDHIFGIHTPSCQSDLVIDSVSEWLAQRFQIISPTYQEETKPCRKIILDADNCIFNYRYHDSVDKNVVAHNPFLIDYLIEGRQDFSKITVGCGSLRQSEHFDNFNSDLNETSSCFLAIEQIAKHLDIDIAPLLLADIFGDLPLGASYHRMMHDYWKESHHGWIPDESKLTLIYAHCQDVDPVKKYVIDFFDDLDDMLAKLYTFFKSYKEMIPSNVALRLNYYEGDAIRRSKLIQGKGCIDINYRQTVVDMYEITRPGHHCVDYVTPTLLAQHRASVNEGSRVTDRETSVVYLTKKSANLQKMVVKSNYTSLQSDEQALRRTLCTQGISEAEQDYLIRVRILRLNIQRGVLNKVQILLDRTPSLVSAIDERGCTLLHFAVLAKKHQLMMVRNFLQLPVDLNKVATLSEGELTALDLALIRGLDAVAVLLFEAGAKFTSTPISTKHIIHICAQKGLLHHIKLIIELNRSVLNQADDRGYSPLQIALLNGHIDMICYLIDEGADVHFSIPVCRTHVKCQVDRKQEGYLQAPLLWAAFKGYQCIVDFLIAHGADVHVVTKLPKGHIDYENDNNSSLDWAIIGQHTDVILMLLKAGVVANHSHGKARQRVFDFSIFKSEDRLIDASLDISDEEMATAAFGRGLNLFKG